MAGDDAFSAPKGTFDLLPEAAARHDSVLGAARELFERAGYGRIETPAFEQTALFARGVGAATDIVRKEMFSFLDQGERELTLRPEGTAPICRAYVDHGMHKLAQPVKLWYAGPFFRQERPQKGRFRQFSQVGAEAIGSDSPLVDAELIVLLDDLLRGLGVPGLTLRLGSLGSLASRAAYGDELREYLREHESELAPDVRERLEQNPLRAFDSADEGTREVMAGAPVMLDRLEPEDAEHFEAVKELLERAGVNFEIDPHLVRGLDYYTRTVFEFTCDRLGAQSGVGGGGRYDSLVEQLGGDPAPAAGWAAGIERILLALASSEGERAIDEQPAIDAFVVYEEGERGRAFAIAIELRRAGVGCDLDLAGRSRKGQMKHADRLGARHAVFVAPEGIELRDMASGEQFPVEAGDLAEAIAGADG